VTDDYLDVTTEQLLALSRGLGFADPMFLRSPPVADWPEEVRTEVEILGVRSLIARDLVRVGEDGMQVPQQLRDVMSAICDPTIVVAAMRARNQDMQVANFYSGNVDTVSHQPAAGGNHRLRLFPTNRLLELIDRVCEVGVADAPNGDVIRLDEEVVQNVTRAGLAGPDPDSMAEDLAALGVSAEATTVLEAIGDEMSLANVTVLHQISESEVEGSTTAWLSGAGSGSWVVTRDGSDAVITPTSGGDVMKSITAGLPAGFPVDQR